MKEEIIDLVVIYCDNTSSINISKNLVIHTNTQQIAIKYHHLIELFQDKEVRLEYVNTKEKIVDIFTKDLPKDAHEYVRGKLGVIPLSKATSSQMDLNITCVDHNILQIDADSPTLGVV